MAEKQIRSLPSELVESQMRDSGSSEASLGPNGSHALTVPPRTWLKRDNGSRVTVPPRTWLRARDIMSTNVATVSPDSPVVSAAKIMSSNNVSCLIVSDNRQVFGIITETDMLKKTVAYGNDFCNMKVEQIMSSPVRSVPPDLSVMDASSIMEAENIRRLVVLDRGRSVGIITQTDMVRALASYTLAKEISEIMTNDVVVIASSASVRAAAELMASKDISCLVATNNGAVVGVFTERDLLKRVIAVKRNPDQTRLKEVMSSPVVSISREQSVLGAMKMLESIGIRRLVVMDGETLYGLVTQTDILKAIKADLQEEEQNYMRLLSESSNCIFMVDANLNTTYVNPAFMKLLDVTDSDELMNKSFLPERFWDNPRERAHVLGQLHRASVEVQELTLKTTMNKRLFVTLFSTHTKNIRGEISGSQGVLYDVTAKKELAALRETQEQSQSGQSPLAENPDCTDGILVLDDKGRVSNVNRRFAEIWNIPEDVMGEQDSEKLAQYVGSQLEELPPFFARVQASCLTEEESYHTLHLKNGKVLKVCSLALDREEPFAGQIWSFRDITGSHN